MPKNGPESYGQTVLPDSHFNWTKIDEKSQNWEKCDI